jgi:hypothetical protein
MCDNLKFASDKDKWNLKILNQDKSPPLNYNQHENNILNDFKVKLCNQYKNLEDLIMQNNNFFIEKNILNKIIYKNFNIFRKEKNIQYLKKLMRLLDNLNAFDLSNLFKNVKFTEEMLCFPSKEFFDFVITKLCASLKIVDCSIKLIKDKLFQAVVKSIKNCIFLPNNVLFLSIISRLYVIIKDYRSSLSHLYLNLKETINILKSINKDWAVSFKFPFLKCFSDSKNAEDILTIQKTLKENSTNGILANGDDLGELINREESHLNSGIQGKIKNINLNSSSDRKKYIRNIANKIIMCNSFFIEKKPTKIIKKLLKCKFKHFLRKNLSKYGSSYLEFLKDLADNLNKFKKICRVFKNYSIKSRKYFIKLLLFTIKQNPQ